MENASNIKHLVCLSLQTLAALTDFRSGEYATYVYKIVDYDPMFAWVRILVIDIADGLYTPYNVVIDLDEFFKSDYFKNEKSAHNAIDHILVDAVLKRRL